jgi:hypothetical protein
MVVLAVPGTADADNRAALSAGRDEDMLRIEPGDLQTEGFDRGRIGTVENDHRAGWREA